jgi:predicted RNA-binding protein YlxR (DUF448 family)
MNDPFQITEPTCISFSGGRTSAYMLWRVIQSGGGNYHAKQLSVLPTRAKKMKPRYDLCRIVQNNGMCQSLGWNMRSQLTKLSTLKQQAAMVSLLRH